EELFRLGHSSKSKEIWEKALSLASSAVASLEQTPELIVAKHLFASIVGRLKRLNLAQDEDIQTAKKYIKNGSQGDQGFKFKPLTEKYFSDKDVLLCPSLNLNWYHDFTPDEFVFV
ncbi:MAG: hypothetical protein Q8P67_27475, partial [archaeon]|nr:hypothetical protein [archaeon]